MQPQQGGLSANWGNPQWIQDFRTKAISQYGQKQVDDFIAQNQAAYLQQSQNKTQSVVGQNQGGQLTPNQLQQNPVGGLQFLQGGGQVANTGPDAQALFEASAQKLLDKAKGKGKYVDPKTYNDIKAQFSGVGGDEPTFDARFGQYTDPTKIINYNTPEGRANQEAYSKITRQLQAQIDQYHNVPRDQKDLFSKGALADVPVLGQLIAPQAYSYESNRKALAGQLSAIVGGGPGSGLKVTNADMDRWAKLLPSTTNTSNVNEQNLSALDKQLKAAFNVPKGLDTHYLPSNGRAPLSSFQQ